MRCRRWSLRKMTRSIQISTRECKNSRPRGRRDDSSGPRGHRSLPARQIVLKLTPQPHFREHDVLKHLHYAPCYRYYPNTLGCVGCCCGSPAGAACRESAIMMPYCCALAVSLCVAVIEQKQFDEAAHVVYRRPIN